MAVTAGQVSTTISEVVGVGESILAIVGAEDPAVELTVEAAAGTASLIADLVEKVLAAWQASSGIPITVESVMALMPESGPLDPPDTQG